MNRLPLVVRMGVPRMSSSRVAGWPLLIGAALMFLAQISQTVLFGGNDTAHYVQHSLFVPTNLVTAAGAILALWGLPLLTTTSRGQGLGWLGRTGSFLIFIGGAMLGVFFGLVGAILTPYLATRTPGLFGNNGPASLFAFFLVASVALFLGSIFLAVPLVRGRALSRWPGYALLVSAAFGVVSFILTGPGSSSEIGIIVSGLNPLLLFVGLGWLGLLLVSRPTQAEAIAGAE